MKYSVMVCTLVASLSWQSMQAQVKDSLSYGLGVLLSQSLKKDFKADELDATEFALGFEDGLNSKEALTPQQAQQFIQMYMQQKVMGRQGEADKAQAAYFEKLAKTKGIQKTESGIYYEVLEKGSGPQPTAKSTVKTHYHGTTIDGQVFDSSVERKSPATFPVGGVIQGWQEILPMMKVGSKWRVHIPYALAYGAQSPSPKIPAFSPLVFEIELIEIVK